MSVADFISRHEADPAMAARLSQARQRMAGEIDQITTLRRLRLAAGFSQDKLAEAAKTSQAYIARVEAGTLDPGSDMVARMASALRLHPVVVFEAIRTQRDKLGASSG
jgi:predicted transcriptional regulator